MADKALIVHGWSSSSSRYLSIRQLLLDEHLYQNIKLVNYKSLDDQVSLADFADKFEQEYQKLIAQNFLEERERIDIICHSTGALVVRAWLALRRLRQRRQKQQPDMPVEHLLMFAPANFGSDVARLGRSALNRLRTTFRLNLSENADTDIAEVGQNILQNALEVGGVEQWKLSNFDLHQEDYFGGNDDDKLTCYPFVFAAGNFDLIDEDERFSGFLNRASRIVPGIKSGTDNTVRICGTSVNTRKCIIHLGKNESESTFTWLPEKKFDAMPFAVFPQFNHTQIVQEGLSKKESQLFDLLKEVIKVESKEEYSIMANVFDETNKSNYDKPDLTEEQKTIYQQFFFVVKDDLDNIIDDYFIDFVVYDRNNKVNRQLTRECQKQFDNNKSWSANSANTGYRVLMINHQEISNFFQKVQQNKCHIKILVEAPSISRDIKFIEGESQIFPTNSGTNFLFPNVTTLVEIVIDRNQNNKILSIH